MLWSTPHGNRHRWLETTSFWSPPCSDITHRPLHWSEIYNTLPVDLQIPFRSIRHGTMTDDPTGDQHTRRAIDYYPSMEVCALQPNSTQPNFIAPTTHNNSIKVVRPKVKARCEFMAQIWWLTLWKEWLQSGMHFVCCPRGHTLFITFDSVGAQERIPRDNCTGVHRITWQKLSALHAALIYTVPNWI